MAKHITNKEAMRLAFKDMLLSKKKEDFLYLRFTKFDPKTFVKDYINIEWESTETNYSMVSEIRKRLKK